MSINLRKALLIILVVALGSVSLPLSVAATPSNQEDICDGADYTVQATDWLSKLAEKNYGDVLAYPRIVEATNVAAVSDTSYATIENADLIEIGWKLCIPGVEVAQSFVNDEAEAALAPKDIVEIAVSDGRFNTLVAAVTATDLVDTLKSEGPFTVFAPTDDAFAALPAGTIEGLLSDIPALTNILLYHVLPGKVMAAEVSALSAATTVQGDDVTITVEGDSVMVNGATVIITDIEATNGVIHVIDAVILPPSAEEAPATPTPAPVEEEEPATPTPAPVEEEEPATPTPAPVEEEEPATPTPAPVEEEPATPTPAPVEEEAPATPIPTPTPTPTPAPVEEEAPAATLDIIDTAKADGRFNVLISNLEQADLDRVLQGVGPFTVFAPTDDAFTAMPVNILASLLLDSNALKQTLLYHVVSGKLMAADLADLDTATSLQRGLLDITLDGDDVMVNGAKVIISDIETTNGVIHVIDTVLVP